MKKALASALALLFLALPLGGQAQRMPRVGILWISERSRLSERHGAFEQGLRDLGWVNGQTSSSRRVSRKERRIACQTLRWIWRPCRSTSWWRLAPKQ